MSDDLDFAYDLVIIGGNASGLSVAVSSLRSGLKRVRVIEPSHAVVFPELIGDAELDVGYGESVESIDAHGDLLVINTTKLSYRTKGCLVALRSCDNDWRPPLDVEIGDRIHIDLLPGGHDDDVLVVGHTDHAVELAVTAAAAGSRVVLAAGGMDPTRLSPAGDNMLRRVERERRATILYRSVPEQIEEVDNFPMAFFADRHTPDLVFDHVTFASNRLTLRPADIGVTDEALATGRVWFVGEPDDSTPPTTAPGATVGRAIASACFPDLRLKPERSAIDRRSRHQGAVEELRLVHYNATITQFEPTHSDLWVLRVRPDTGGTSFVPGQYASLGLGYWEPRIDGAEDPELDTRWDKLIRRSYSISSTMFDEHGYLADEPGSDELEFYVVLVKPSPDNIPGLTPRLALCRPGDRIYLGPKVAGRYTLSAVIDPGAAVVFLGTGTGEAPHNAMAVELLRKGHYGPIVSVVSVRQWHDLGYLEKHRHLESRYGNYHYLPMPTREHGVEKRYIQDVFRQGLLKSEFGVDLDPSSSHVYMCGNPAMIGLPDSSGDEVLYPEPEGVVEILERSGFKLDRRNDPGNVHYEEYW